MNRDFRDLLAEFNAHNVEFLIKNKRAAGRTQDLADVERLLGKEKNNPNKSIVIPDPRKADKLRADIWIHCPTGGVCRGETLTKRDLLTSQ